MVAVFSVVCVCVTIYQSMRIARLETTGLRAQGEVVRLQQEYSFNDHGDRYVYYPIVAYRVDTNLTVEFKDSVGSNPPIYRRGDKVTVLYLSDNPQHEAIIDRGFWGNWLISAILFVASAFLIMLLIVMLRGRTAQTPPTAAAFTDLRRQAPT